MTSSCMAKQRGKRYLLSPSTFSETERHNYNDDKDIPVIPGYSSYGGK